MKKTMVITLSALMLLVGSFSPKEARAVDPGTIVSGGLIASAVGLGIWTMYELIVVGDELSASTSEISGQVYNKKQLQYLDNLKVDAAEFIFGEYPSVTLTQVMNKTRGELEERGQDMSDEELAVEVIKYTDSILNSK